MNFHVNTWTDIVAYQPSIKKWNVTCKLWPCHGSGG
jgi:hypothetical protein